MDKLHRIHPLIDLLSLIVDVINLIRSLLG